MHTYLMFQLYGTMASWGGIAVGESRASETHAGRSALIGLLAAALGVEREDEENQKYLARQYNFAVCLHNAGVLVKDYHTTQVAPRSVLKKYPGRTRYDEIAAPRSELSTILSSRDYRCDAYCRVAVQAREESPRWTLEALKDALNQPVFTLYLGRKSCPPALPLQAQCVVAPDLLSAFRDAVFLGPEQFAVRHLGAGDRPRRLEASSGSLYWDDGMAAGIEPRETLTRRDQPRNRRRWQFDERPERHAAWSTQE